MGNISGQGFFRRGFDLVYDFLPSGVKAEKATLGESPFHFIVPPRYQENKSYGNITTRN